MRQQKLKKARITNKNGGLIGSVAFVNMQNIISCQQLSNSYQQRLASRLDSMALDVRDHCGGAGARLKPERNRGDAGILRFRA